MASTMAAQRRDATMFLEYLRHSMGSRLHRGPCFPTRSVMEQLVAVVAVVKYMPATSAAF